MFTTGLNPGAAPEAIAPGPDGNLWFTDVGTTKAIGRITPAGTITMFTTGLNPGAAPEWIAPGPDGNLWFTDLGTTPAIGRITPAGTITMLSGTGLNPGAQPFAIAPGPDGALWFTDSGTTPAIGRVTTAGTITEFSDGLNPGAVFGWPAPGSDGNIWFADQGTTHSVGRIGAGVAAASLDPPAVTGSAQQGIQQVCQGDRWATWAGEQPLRNASSSSPFGYQWLRDGTPLGGETGQTYVPVAGDVGHTLACKVAVFYSLLQVTALATSDPVTVIPQSSGPQGPQGSQGPQGPPGRDATVTCKVKGKKKIKCKVAFAAAAGVTRARLSRHGDTYAAGKPKAVGGKLVLRFSPQRRLKPGGYTLTVIQRVDGRRVVTKSALSLR